MLEELLSRTKELGASGTPEVRIYPPYVRLCMRRGWRGDSGKLLPCFENRSLEVCLTQVGGRGAEREKRNLYAALHNIFSASDAFISYARRRESSEASSATTLPVLLSLLLRVGVVYQLVSLPWPPLTY